MKSLRSLRGEYEERYDEMELSPEDISILVETYVYKAGMLGHDPMDILDEARTLEITLTRSTVYNYANRHLKVVK